MNGPSSIEHAVAELRAWHDRQPGVVTGRGLEPLIVGATLAVPKKTWLLPGRRERGCALLRGAAPDRVDEARPYRVLPPGPSPVARALQAVGMAGKDGALCFLGTGSVGYGAFSEALSLTSTLDARVVFVVSWYLGEGPFAAQLSTNPARLAEGLGLKATTVDGGDAERVRAAVAGLKGQGVVVAELRPGA